MVFLLPTLASIQVAEEMKLPDMPANIKAGILPDKNCSVIDLRLLFPESSPIPLYSILPNIEQLELP